tara:strand:+ start:206 stop:1249 length:1044 start_codon:yes stop_codon:yes gene_type:complete
MTISKLKYIGAYFSPLLAILSFNLSGYWAFIGVATLYILVPILEQFLPKDTYNLTKSEKELAKKDKFYDWILYLLAPVQLYVVYVFLTTISRPDILFIELLGYSLMMGTILGVNGINGGHELGHKTEHPIKIFLAHVLLMTSLQNHFMTYHNSGHHKDVATPNDLTTAKKGQSFYSFAFQSQIGGYFKTWKLENEKLKKRGKNPLLNPMILTTLVPWLFQGLIFFHFGYFVGSMYFLASVFGISILESQNYFSHYGLQRKLKEDGSYERVKVHHSWNSDHLIGRILLFELTRHSDHHFAGAKPYQILESKEGSPVLPYGYPAMLIMGYFPFIFKPVMAKQLAKYKVK